MANERYIFEVPDEIHIPQALNAIRQYRLSGYKGPCVITANRDTGSTRYCAYRTKTGTSVVKWMGEEKA